MKWVTIVRVDTSCYFSKDLTEDDIEDYSTLIGKTVKVREVEPDEDLLPQEASKEKGFVIIDDWRLGGYSGSRWGNSEVRPATKKEIELAKQEIKSTEMRLIAEKI